MYLWQAGCPWAGRQDAAHAVVYATLGAVLSLQRGFSLWNGTASGGDFSFSAVIQGKAPGSFPVVCHIRTIPQCLTPLPASHLHISLLCRASGISTTACCFLFWACSCFRLFTLIKWVGRNYSQPSITRVSVPLTQSRWKRSKSFFPRLFLPAR